MRSLGQFFGFLAAGVKSTPETKKVEEVKRTVEVEERGGVVLRKTTIEEIEYRGAAPPSPAGETNANQSDETRKSARNS